MKKQELIEKLEQFDSDADIKIEIDSRLHDCIIRTDCEILTGEQYFDRLNGHLISEIILYGTYN